MRWTQPRILAALFALTGIGLFDGHTCEGQDAPTLPPPVRVDPLHGKALIAGRVVDSTGKPVERAEVRVYGLADILVAAGSYEFGWASAPPDPRAVVTTDATGRFSASELVRGMNVLVVETRAGERGFGLTTAVEEHPVEVLLRTHPVALLRGVVLDEDGSPIPGAPVLARPSNIFPMGALSMLHVFSGTTRTRSDSAGRFELRAEESVNVAACRPRDGRWTLRVPYGEVLAPGAEIRIKFATGGVLAARVHGEKSGRPIGGAKVIVVARPDTEGCTLLTTLTDAHGSLSIPSFPAVGSGGFAIVAPGIGADWRDARTVLGGRVAVRRGATLTGHVRTEEGAPVAGAAVILHPWSWPAMRVTTNEAGAYEIHGLPRTRPWIGDPAHQANGIHEAWVEAPGYASEQQVLSLSVGANEGLVTEDFVLRKGSTVRGRCDPAEAGRLLSWAPVDFGPFVTDLFPGWTGIAEDGSFVFTDLPAGRIFLGMTDEGVRTAVVDGLKPGESRSGLEVPRSK